VSGGQIGDMARSLAAFIADPERCGVVLATLAEEMPVQELSELVALLRERMGRPPELVVANGLYPEFPGGWAGRRTGGQALVEASGTGAEARPHAGPLTTRPPGRDRAPSGAPRATRGESGPRAERGGVPQGPSVIDLWRERRAVNDRELTRLRGVWKGPLAEVPLVPLDRSPELLAAVEAVLGGELA